MDSKRVGWIACLVGSCIVLANGQAAPAGGPQAAAPAPGPSGGVAQVQTKALDPFSRVALCVPFTVLVQPSSAYQLTVDAETAVQQAVSVLIDGDTLILESSAFTTQQQIKVTVGLPASKLSAVTARGTAPVIVSPGFSAAKLTVMAQGTGSLGVLGVNYTKVDVVNSGTGTTVISGLLTNATVMDTGTGAVYLAGLTNSASVTLSGTGSIYINSTSATSSITGSSTGTGKVFYTAGACNVQSTTPEWIFGPKCQQGPITVPDTSATWTCGIQVRGNYACAGGQNSSQSQSSSSQVSNGVTITQSGSSNNSGTVQSLNIAGCPRQGSAQDSNAAGCTQETVTFPTAGSVSSYSLIDSKVGNALGLDTITPQGTPGNGGTGGGGGGGSNPPVAPPPVNGVQNGQGNTGSNNGQGNGAGSVGAGNGNFNGNGNAGSNNGNGNGVGSVGNGNGQNNGNNNSPTPSGR